WDPPAVEAGQQPGFLHEQYRHGRRRNILGGIAGLSWRLRPLEGQLDLAARPGGALEQLQHRAQHGTLAVGIMLSAEGLSHRVADADEPGNSDGAGKL